MVAEHCMRNIAALLHCPATITTAYLHCWLWP